MGTYTPAPVTRWVVGVDLGQSIDPTAVCIIESTQTFARQVEGEPERRPVKVTMDVRHLERLPLRMSYPEQVAYVGAILRRPPIVKPDLVIDMTGVGRPVFDMFKQAL